MFLFFEFKLQEIFLTTEDFLDDANLGHMILLKMLRKEQKHQCVNAEIDKWS